ncbi:flavin reductase family protein [Acidocella sp.]|uniref:flavin reductase family protein n=1 Tax=Acidocella sp. TaxID=50710 RepID=UPI003D02213D
MLTGAEIDVSVPRNHFGLEEDAGESLLLAGGIGITPIYAMFRHLREHGKAVRLHYWSRSPSDMLFSESLQAEQNVYLHHSSSGRRDVADILHDTAPGTVVYCCGPRRMLEACQAAMPRGCVLKTENFLPAASPDDACMQGFSVYLAKSDCTVEVATNQTILQALLSAGIDAPYSCEEGVCGACEVSLLAGEALHLDAVRLPAEHDRLRTVMVCCSRAKTNSLTLDL